MLYLSSFDGYRRALSAFLLRLDWMGVGGTLRSALRDPGPSYGPTIVTTAEGSFHEYEFHYERVERTMFDDFFLNW